MDFLARSSSTARQVNDGSPTRQTHGQTVHNVYRLLVNQVGSYLTANNGQWFYRHQTLHPRDIEAAIKGEMYLGLQAVSGSGDAKWFCLDVDEDEYFDHLREVATRPEFLGHSLLEKSRRGGHLFFFHSQVSWDHSQFIGQGIAQLAGLDGIEVYPKSHANTSVKMPGTRHPKTGLFYPIIDIETGFDISLEEALDGITAYQLPRREVEVQPYKPINERNDEFEALVNLLRQHTSVRVYADRRAIAKCLWHDDHNPSLLIVRNRFHCQRDDCVWGDLNDLRRWIEKGIRPPSH